MKNTKLDTGNSLIKSDISANSTKDQDIEKYKQMKREGIIKIIQRQTDYDIETAIKKLDFWDGNYLYVIKEWLNPNFNNKKDEKPAKKSKNQMKWGEIRNFMDDVNHQQLWRKRQKEHIEKQKIAYMFRLKQMEKENQQMEDTQDR